MTKSYKLPKSLLTQVSPNDKVYSVRLNQESQEILENTANENNISKSDVIRIALKNLIK